MNCNNLFMLLIIYSFIKPKNRATATRKTECLTSSRLFGGCSLISQFFMVRWLFDQTVLYINNMDHVIFFKVGYLFVLLYLNSVNYMFICIFL